MRTYTLERYVGIPQATIGELRIGDITYYSMERPWKENKPFFSCIPLGEYILDAHDSKKHPDTFALVNEEIGVYHYDHGSGRYGILIHVGNTARDFEGCIGFGVRLGCLDREWAVLRSRDATEEVIRHLKAGDIIKIVEKKVQWKTGS